MKVFLTGFITTPYAREFLAKCAGVLRERGFECYTPSQGGWQPDGADRAESTLAQDYLALEQAEVLLAIVDYYNVNDGVASQIGAFYALMQRDSSKKGILGILHDTRVAGRRWEAGAATLNYCILGCINAKGRVVPSFDDALGALLDWAG